MAPPRSVLGLTAALVAGAIEFTAVAADQPQWGQAWSRNMISHERGLPEVFDPRTGQNIKWRTTPGTETHATPVVAGGRVYLGTNNNRPRDARHSGDRGVLMCFDESTGEFLWQLVVPKLTNSIYWDWPHAGICSPPSVEGERVYLVSNRGEVLCLDARGMTNGNDGPSQEEAAHCVPAGASPMAPGPHSADILWRFDMIQELQVRQHDSAHASVLIHGDFLYVNTANGVDDTHKEIHSPDAPSLIVLDKATGRLVARDGERIGPRIFHSTWSSPALGQVDGEPRVFFCGGDGVVYGFVPVTTAPPPGQVLTLRKVWQFDFDPDAPKEAVHRFNGNRDISPSNMHGMPVFHDGRLYVAGGGDLWWGKRQAWLKCLQTTGTGDVTKTALVWSYALAKHVMATPALGNGLVFLGDCGRRIHCVDAATGQAVWTHDAGGEIWASPLLADGKVYFATRRGQALVFAADREKKLLHQVALGDPVSATPVATNGTIYFATMRNLFAVAAGASAP